MMLVAFATELTMLFISLKTFNQSSVVSKIEFPKNLNSIQSGNNFKNIKIWQKEVTIGTVSITYLP